MELSSLGTPHVPWEPSSLADSDPPIGWMSRLGQRPPGDLYLAA